MVPASQDPNSVFPNLINESVFLVYSTRPTALHFMLEQLGFADSCKRIALDVLDQLNNS
jgi:hypothetical protein